MIYQQLKLIYKQYNDVGIMITFTPMVFSKKINVYKSKHQFTSK